MKFRNKGAVLVQIALLFISQPRNQNQSIYQFVSLAQTESGTVAMKI